MLYLGKPKNHSADTYRFLNLATTKVIHSRDATWLNKVHGEWKRLAKPVRPEMATLLHMMDKADPEKIETRAQGAGGAGEAQAAGGGARDTVTFGHPSGTLKVGAVASQSNGEWSIEKVVMSRSARVLMEGFIRVPGD